MVTMARELPSMRFIHSHVRAKKYYLTKHATIVRYRTRKLRR